MMLYTLLLASTIQLVAGDYHIGYSISSYNNPGNRLSDGTCCDGTCTAGSCRTTLRLCFRNFNHSRSDTTSECTSIRNHENAEFFTVEATAEPAISSYYEEMFQLYVRVSHSLEQNTSLADFLPPFTDPHIDDIFFDEDIAAVTYNSLNVVDRTATKAGVHGQATLSVSLNVVCAQNYYGSGCEMLCDDNGINCNTVLEPPGLTSSDNVTENESLTTLTPDTPTNSPTTIDLATSRSTSIPDRTQPTNNATTTRRRPVPSGRLSSGVLAGIIVACVLIVIGVLVITLTLIAVAVYVHRKHKKTIHKLQARGRGTVLESNETYEAIKSGSLTTSVDGNMLTTSVDDNIAATSVDKDGDYESMEMLREVIQTEANDAYDRVHEVQADNDEDTYESVS